LLVEAAMGEAELDGMDLAPEWKNTSMERE
jgi:hypothetical protein